MLNIKGLNKNYNGGENILENINLTVEKGEFVSLLGPSGCGKSTLLNIIAGVSKEYTGVCENNFNKTCVMFQEGGLFPWLNVYENVEFGIKKNIKDKEKRKEIVNKYLKMVHLSSFKEKNINELSGGMKQRVALARALAYESDMVILDEPFSALDSQTRDILLLQIQKIWSKTNKTFIFVTHNIEEAVMLSNRIVLLSVNPGKVKKIYEIKLPRPRTVLNKEIRDYVIEIQKDLKEEVMKFVKKEYDGDYNLEEDDILYDPSSNMEYYL